MSIILSKKDIPKSKCYVSFTCKYISSCRGAKTRFIIPFKTVDDALYRLSLLRKNKDFKNVSLSFDKPNLNKNTCYILRDMEGARSSKK